MARPPSHGHSRNGGVSPTYRTWRGLWGRIRNPNAKDYKGYGGRGIDMDPRWYKFELFLADMGEKPDGLTLERVDNNKGYWPNNCVWATRRAQARNRRNNKITYAIAEEIRYMHYTGSSYNDLIRIYKLSLGGISAIINRKMWDKPF